VQNKGGGPGDPRRSVIATFGFRYRAGVCPPRSYQNGCDAQTNGGTHKLSVNSEIHMAPSFCVDFASIVLLGAQSRRKQASVFGNFAFEFRLK